MNNAITLGKAFLIIANFITLAAAVVAMFSGEHAKAAMFFAMLAYTKN
jgi:hypothetical protein